MQEHNERKVGFYIRVSTDRQAQVEEGSLKNQEQMLRAELARRNERTEKWGVFVESYVDEGISGKNTNRPALRRMMDDIAVGRVTTVMFTELSRLSRSLRDFLSIFEFARAHDCDLICLKTEIDTTSAYSALVTKILMIFAEFEREMTVERTRVNAYERARRGLANGGPAPLGYRRDPEHKGYLLVDETERVIVREIYEVYLRESSLKETTRIIRERHEGSGPKLLRITKNKIHVVLTNKSYIGVKVINRRDGARRTEVPAVWEPIISGELFERVRKELRENRNGQRPARSTRYVYLFSGLIRCGLCGAKLTGGSGRSSNGSVHHYYRHPSACTKGPSARVDADTVHRLVLGWLREIADGGEAFERFTTEATTRLHRSFSTLTETLNELDQRHDEIETETEARITELTRTSIDSVRESIESSIATLAEEKKDLATRRLYLEHEIAEISELLADPKLFRNYRKTVAEAIAGTEAGGSGSDARRVGVRRPIDTRLAIQTLFSRLSLFPSHIETALARDGVGGPVAQGRMFVIAPPDRLNDIDDRILAECVFDLPEQPWMLTAGELRVLYLSHGLNTWQIARLARVGHSTIIEHMKRHGIKRPAARKQRPKYFSLLAALLM